MIDKEAVRRGPRLQVRQQRELTKDVTAQEIKDALFSIDSNKAPGIDGFNAYFFKKSWAIIGGEIIEGVQQFFCTGYLPQEMNVALISLIPKKENATAVRDFRPIACCTVMYKIISKVLANRLQRVLDVIICDSQSAFVQGRLIFDNIILSHELVKGYNRKHISPRCMVKVDIQKAYDSVEWPFIKQMLDELGFPYQFTKWIMICLTSVTYTINVNGELVEPFQARRGIRQGDPISPYLFVICMEYLNRCLMGLEQNRNFHYHPRCKKLHLTHVCFADDLLLFTRGDVSSIRQLMEVLDRFARVSGLIANQQKSNVYFGGVDSGTKQEILDATGMTEGQLPFKYLGVPLSTQKLSMLQCQPLINRILQKMNTWAAKLLSYAGRVQLIQTVIFGIQKY